MNNNSSLEALRTHFECQTYDKNYQDVDCLGLKGYDRSAPSWEKILQDLGIDFSNKSVCDLGCFHLYYSLAALKAGASFVYGLDKYQPVLDTSALIAEVEGVSDKISLQQWEGGAETPKCDIALVLNVLHHCTNQELTLKNIQCESAVFEINAEQIPLVSNFFEIKRMTSGREYAHRPPRVLAWGIKR